MIGNVQKCFEQLIKEYFDLVERIMPVQSECIIANEDLIQYPNFLNEMNKEVSVNG